MNFTQSQITEILEQIVTKKDEVGGGLEPPYVVLQTTA